MLRWKHHLWLQLFTFGNCNACSEDTHRIILRRFKAFTSIQCFEINWTQSNESQLHKLPLELWNSVTQTYESSYSVSMNRSLLLWCIASCVCWLFTLLFIEWKIYVHFNYHSHSIVKLRISWLVIDFPIGL